MKKFISFALSFVIICTLCVIPGFAVKSEIAEIGTKGTFSTITYNVAGLPWPSTLESLNPDGKDVFQNTKLIGKVLNTKSYDIISTQEDFNYDTYLRQELTDYNYMTEHKGGVPLGDGLNVFTKNYELSNTYREQWEVTYGGIDEGDTLTEKGFMVTTIKLDDGVYLDYYVIHADAFDTEGSVEARNDEFTQLADYIEKNSANRPIIITGDFNCYLLHSKNSTDMLGLLIERLGLNDSWAVINASNYVNGSTLQEFHLDDYSRDVETVNDYTAYHTLVDALQTVDYTNSWGVFDSAERFLYRDGGGVKLSINSFSYEWFYDAKENKLSDHAAAIASFDYEVVAEPYNTTEIIQDANDSDSGMGFLWKFIHYVASIFKAIGALFAAL